MADSIPVLSIAQIRKCAKLSEYLLNTSNLPFGLHTVLVSGGGQSMMPYFFVSSDGTDLYITIRGSCEPADFIMDLEFDRIEYSTGKVHSGIFRGAKFIIGESLKGIQSCTGNVFVTGHSMGGSLSAMVALILRTDYGMNNVYAVSLAPFPVMSLDLASECEPFVVSFVYNNDAVPRLTSKNISALVNTFAPPSNPNGKFMLMMMGQQLLGGFVQASGGSQGQVAELQTKIQVIVDKLMEMVNKEEEFEFFLPGIVYHFTPSNVTRVDPYDFAEGTADLLTGVMDHNFVSYENCLMAWNA